MNNHEISRNTIDILRGYLFQKGKYKHGMTTKQIVDKTAQELKREHNIILEGPDE